MIRLADILTLVPKITPTEARMAVLASWTSEANTPLASLQLAGQVTGPLCEYATTLSERVPLQNIGVESGNRIRAAAQILEPCFWEPQHPFCYEVQLELHGNAGLLDMRRIITGIRHLEVDGNELLLNGQPTFIQGVKHFIRSSIVDLEAWHDADCSAFLTDASSGLCERTDRWGPMVFHMLMPDQEAETTRQVTQLRNHPSLVMWVLPPGINGEALDLFVNAIRELDRSRPIGRLLWMNESAPAQSSVDVLFLPMGHAEMGSLGVHKPYIVVGSEPPAAPPCRSNSFAERVAQFRSRIGSPAGLVGVML